MTNGAYFFMFLLLEPLKKYAIVILREPEATARISSISGYIGVCRTLRTVKAGKAGQEVSQSAFSPASGAAGPVP